MLEINIGGHLSLGKDPRATVRWAAENGFSCMQIFVSSPGAWKAPIVDRARFDDFLRARQEYGVAPLFIHAIYLINLASQDARLVSRSKDSLIAALRAGEALGAAGVVTHIGSHGGRGFQQVRDQVALAIGEILHRAASPVDLILENSAGAGGIIGSSLHELGDLVDRAGGHPRLRVALDTAHLCAAGWHFGEAGVAERLVMELDHAMGCSRLVLLHANDSRSACGSRKDRHANIGEGAVGLDGFRNLLAQPVLRGAPWVLETPDLERRVDDLATLRALAVPPLPSSNPTLAPRDSQLPQTRAIK